MILACSDPERDGLQNGWLSSESSAMESLNAIMTDAGDDIRGEHA